MTIEGVIVVYLVLLGLAFLAMMVAVGWWMSNE